MAWSAGFREALTRDTVYPRYWFRTVPDFNETTWGRKGIAISSINTPGWVSAIVREGSTVTYGRLQPRTWRKSHGTLQLAVASWYPPGPRVTRGMPVELLIGFTDDPNDAETVWWGTVRNVTRRMPNWVIECVDGPGSLTSRVSSTAGYLSLFNRLAPGTVGAGYTAGNPTIDITETFSPWEQSQAGGMEGYLLKITPNTGSDFYILANPRVLVGGSTYRYTVVNSGFMNTTDANANVGNAVQAMAYSEGHPLNIARAVMVSTGVLNQNGDRDFYPQTWGYGIPKRLVAHKDIQRHRELSAVASGADSWVMYTDERQDNGFGFLESFFEDGGFFLGTFEGRITARAVLDCSDNGLAPRGVVTPDNVSAILGWQAWSADCQKEYYAVDAVAGGVIETSGATEWYFEGNMDSGPTGVQKQYTFNNIRTNVTAALQSIVSRIGPYLCRVPEGGLLGLRGWSLAHLTAGDIVSFKGMGDLLESRYGSAFDDYDDRHALVIGGGPNWFAGNGTLEFIALPQREEGTVQSTDPGQGSDSPGLED